VATSGAEADNLKELTEMFELMDAYSQSAVIKVIGVGGGGGNAVSHMVSTGIEGVDFICINTDAQALKASKIKTSLQIGSNITKGLGAGADPEVGRQAAMEDRDRIVELIEGCDMLFITAGMGGGTGTGAAPVVAQVARELGILTVAVVTKPFSMEGGKRQGVADHGITELTKHVDSLITIPNQKLLTVLGPTTTLLDAFKAANQVLQGAVQGIAELITRPGLINVDFADVRTVMSETGMAMMGSGHASGESRARQAAEAAVSSPLLEDINLAGAHGVLVNVTAGLDLSIGEFEEVGSIVKEYASEDATVVVGTVIDPEMSNQLRVTVVATGLGRGMAAQRSAFAAGRESQREMPVERGLPVREAGGARAAEGALRAVRSRAPLSASDYSALDKPTVVRQRAVGDGLRPDVSAEELLDIPAFLRRQAD
jgi:cell division protein FtsZ